MKKTAKNLSVFHGCQMLLASVGIGLYCYVDPNAFANVGKESGINLRLFLLTAGLIPQAGLGLLLIWFGMPNRSRMRTWRLARRAAKQIVEN